MLCHVCTEVWFGFAPSIALEGNNLTFAVATLVLLRYVILYRNGRMLLCQRASKCVCCRKLAQTDYTVLAEFLVFS